MASRKRRFEEDSLQIRLAAHDGDAGPVVADRTILAAFSSCVRGLPANTTEWDISKLVIEGQAVEMPAVLAWLNAAHMQTLDEPFDQQQVKPSNSMHDMARLLAFADAVGSTGGLLRSLLGDPSQLYAEVQLEHFSAVEEQQDGEQPPKQPVGVLRLHSSDYYQWSYNLGGGPKLTLTKLACGGRVTLLKIGTRTRKAALVQQVAKQIEMLLYYAYSLHLPALQMQLHGFIQINTYSVMSLLYGAMGLVMSDRVLDAAVDRDFCRRALINSIVTQQGGIMQQRHVQGLLQPVDATIPKVEFKAVLAKDAFGSPHGDTVSVCLMLNGAVNCREPIIKINGLHHVVQLLIGPAVWDDSSMQAIVGTTHVAGDPSVPPDGA